jgi:hypothetical protein
MTRPMVDFKDFKLDKDEIDAAIEEANAPERDDEPSDRQNENQEVPDHVLSIKVLSDKRRNKSMNTPTITDIPLELETFNLPQ